jgi:hypothetical protein
MKIIKYIVLLSGLAVVIGGCQKYEQINTNPDATKQVNSPLLATTLILNITRNGIGSQKAFMQPFLLSKYLTWGERQESYQYNKLGDSNFDSVKVLRNIPPMIKYAKTDALKKSYEGLGHFISAYQFFISTMQVGDMPYAEANRGESDRILQPKYDTQKAVFLGILKELDQANELFATGADFEGDPIYGGRVDNWRRLVNSFELHVLLNLYKKTGDADLKVISRFKDIVANRPLMRDYKDNFALTYTSMAGQNYPWSDVPAGSGNSFVKSNYTMLSNVLLDPLKTLKDKRLFYFAKPSPVKIAAGTSQSDYNAYVGVEPSDAFTALQVTRGTTDYSDLNNRYVRLVNAEPVSVFSYWDLQFALSEGTVRGWIGGTSAQSYYAAGITGSMKFIAVNTPDMIDYHHNMKIDDTYINEYVTSAAVALNGSNEQQISQIITQKYLANFLQGSQFISWFENRRTGYPVFKQNASTSLNIPSANFPVRWFYPTSELNYNAANVKAAIASQYNGSDDNNQLMWILK